MDVAVLALDGGWDTGLATVLDVFTAANALRTRLPEPPPPYRVRTVGPVRRVRTAAGHLVPAEPLPAADAADLVVVPALAERRYDELAELVGGRSHRRVRELLRRTADRGGQIAAACTGTFVVAESGVLDGLVATTSWWLAPQFRQRYPQVELAAGRMVVTAGTITTAGAAMGHLDLALDLVRRTSPSLAELLTRYGVLDERPSQAVYAIPSVLAGSDPVVSAFESWLRAHLAEPLRIADAAAAAGVSERTLQRAVRRVLDRSPIAFAQEIRLEHARHLLRSTDLPVAVVAHRVGYQNAATLRSLLRRRHGVTTTELRAR